MSRHRVLWRRTNWRCTCGLRFGIASAAETHAFETGGTFEGGPT